MANNRHTIIGRAPDNASTSDGFGETNDSNMEMDLEGELDSQKDPDASPSKLATPASSSSALASGLDSTKKKHYFQKELRCMLYGFGDKPVPYQETVDLLEELVVEYIRNMTIRASEIGKPGKVTLEDVWYLTRRDPKKYARVKELLAMNEELKKARKAFDEAKY